MSHDTKLVRMANDIGKFFAAQPGEQAAHDIAAHLRKFWEPRMRADIVAYVNHGGTGLDPAVRAAVEELREAGNLN